jgi:hypothetical protein
VPEADVEKLPQIIASKSLDETCAMRVAAYEAHRNFLATPEVRARAITRLFAEGHLGAQHQASVGNGAQGASPIGPSYRAFDALPADERCPADLRYDWGASYIPGPGPDSEPSESSGEAP